MTIRALLALVVLPLGACVTETESVFTEKAAPKEAMEQRVTLARQYIGQRNWEAAERNLRMALELDDKNAGAYEAFALLYQSTGEIELAEDNFKRAIKLQPDFSRARNNYAAFLYGQQRYAEAEAQLRKVVLDPLYNARPQAFLNLGLCRLQLDDAAGAEEAFKRTINMQPNSTIALLELAQLRLDAQDTRGANVYYDEYRKRVGQQSAKGLWLGVRLARATGNVDAESSYALVLRNLYPESPEYKAHQQSLDEGR
jgi:type IV pilus assembly protein PilF